MSEWFERWFGEEYLSLYPHRDEQEAARAVALLSREGAIGGVVLDLACGAGRHMAAVQARGAAVTGLDLSLPLLRTAQKRGIRELVRGDIRVLPLRSASCDSVLNLFTSFGYFETDEQHERVLAEVARVLKPGGTFVLDFLNAAQTIASLVARDERAHDMGVVVQERSLSGDQKFVTKTIHLSGEGRTFMERVRLYRREELTAMLARAGLAVTAAFGDYDGGPPTDASPRCLLIARRS